MHKTSRKSVYLFMNVKNEIKYDFDMMGPKVTVTDCKGVIENVRQIVSISDVNVVCKTQRFFVSVYGEKIRIEEIWEGRIELAGEIRGLEIYREEGQSKG